MKDRLLSLTSYFALPYLFGKAATQATFRASIPERKGLGDWENLHFPSEKTVWLHGASVGEIGGVLPILQALQAERPELSYLVTTTSLTGKAEVGKRMPNIPVALLPLDYPRAIRRVLDRVNPALVVISETEIWPNLLLELKRRDIPVLLVNGRISDFSFPKYSKIRALLSPLLAIFSKVLVQTHLDAERFVSLGTPRENVFVCGSTKYSQSSEQIPTEEERKGIAADLGIRLDCPTFVAGSVRPGEESIIIDAYREARIQYPDLQLVIAPRHLERTAAIAGLLSEAELPFQKRSERGLNGGIGAPSVLLLDTLGELRNAYAIASMAFVGGSLVDLGGHNPLEPAAFAVPVIFGPYDRNVRDALWQLKQAGGVTVVHNDEELIRCLKNLLHHESLRVQQGEAAKRVAEQNSRALTQVLPVIHSLLPNRDTRRVVNSSAPGN